MVVLATTLLASIAAVEPLAAGIGGESLPAVGAAGIVFALFAPGVLGITDLLDGGDDDDDGDEADDDIFEEGGGDDLGGLGDLDDDGLGDIDDGDGLGGGGNGDVAELQNRIEELEDEVASVSSSVNTVQNENEAVSETVAEIEENVRDLLEIYEMVTRGVNPFVDDAASPGMGADAAGEFGLFDDGQDEEADVDDSIADADAEEFFEDDFEEPDGDALADPDEAAMLDDEGDDLLGGGPDEDADQDASDEEDGKSFEELKEEYESGDPSWDVEDPSGDDATDDLEEAVEDDVDDFAAGDAVDGAAGDAEEFVYGAAENAGGSDEDPEGGDPDDTPPEGEEFDFVGDDPQGSDPDATDRDERVHLAAFPDGYLADLTAIEWLEFLIEVGGPDGARDALGYYVDVGWITPAVEEVLHSFLSGMRVSSVDTEQPEPGGLGQYDPEDHRRSLAYVARLAGDGDRAAAFEQVGGPTPEVSPDPTSASHRLVADGAPGTPPSGGDEDGV